MPIATGTAIVYAATAAAAAAAAYYLRKKDDDNEDEGPEVDPLPLPPPSPYSPFAPPIKSPITPTVVATLDLDFMVEDEGDLMLDADEIEEVDDDDDGGSAGYPYQSNPPPGSGYNEGLFHNFNQVRRVLYGLGYNVPFASWGIQLNDDPEGPEVKRFQSHYNKASESDYADASGYLKEDGKPGARTLRALELAAFGNDGQQPSDLIRSHNWGQEFGV